MNYNLPSHLSDLPIYRKALDIITLSRSISTYLNHDLSYLNPDGSEDNNIYFSGDIVQQSTNLAPEIINAERERYSDKKHKHLESLDRLTTRLYSNCRRLERSNSNGRDYLPILRGELRKFRKLQRNWMMTL
ncbi:hypothetical protein [Winogradskyella sp. SYSU M77433]|uniref:hypothetical protein n=1 Tax=Winogradskyella sp. SYSU M77433 TaxID=3042722 RepID=UPI00248043C4|nr:hypothetical protein [Winogradskyella sp. SYSU M77433]MDH7911224.1 hypothetical protein [Winogradskyella sp. SYSU M77433]|tara:strand:- start:1222 stop:1617 length:396 start_codon:yes stop_codon:yes gene_type:complete